MPVTASLSRAQIVSLIGFDPLFPVGGHPVGECIVGIPSNTGSFVTTTHTAGTIYAASEINWITSNLENNFGLSGSWRVTGANAVRTNDASGFSPTVIKATQYQRVA